jgi:hypothetical protein
MHTHLCYEGLTRHYKNYPGYEGVEGAVADALAQHAAAVTAAQQQARRQEKEHRPRYCVCEQKIY